MSDPAVSISSVQRTTIGEHLEKFKTLYPFEPHFLDLRNARYHYLDEGTGEVLVMLHGNPTWSFHYRNLVLKLRSRYRVVAPDHIGCGLSDKPRNYEYTLRQHTANLEILIQRLELRDITLIMHDWGGPIGMGYAVRNPSMIKRMVVFNTAAFWMPHISLSLRLLRSPLIGPLLIKRLNVFPWAGIFLACRKRRLTPAERAGYLLPYDSPAHRIGIWNFLRDIPLGKSHPSYAALRSTEEGLKRLKNRPMAIFWGGKDPVFTRTFLHEWRKRFPDASVTLIDDAGHYVIEDGFDQVLPPLKEFLENSGAQHTRDTDNES